jgi:hypothetical protein
MNWKRYNLMLVLTLVIASLPSTIFAAQARIEGDYCYQYGDSESPMAAKEISYAMALRKAIETYKIFVASTSVVKDFKLRKDLVETIAAGYVENIKIIKQDVKGRNVCTELVGYVNPDAVKSIIARKVEKTQRARKKEFEGLLSNEYIKVLNYRKTRCQSRSCVEVLYQAKWAVPVGHSVLIIDCFDKDGTPIEGEHEWVPKEDLYKGEVRKIQFVLPELTVSYELRLEIRLY